MRALPRSDRSSTRPPLLSGTVRRNSFDGVAPLRATAINKYATENEAVRDTVLLPSDGTQRGDLMFTNVDRNCGPCLRSFVQPRLADANGRRAKLVRELDSIAGDRVSRASLRAELRTPASSDALRPPCGALPCFRPFHGTGFERCWPALSSR